MYLFEILETEAENIRWQKHGNIEIGMFSIGDQPYGIQFIGISQGDQIHKHLKSAPIGNNTYFVAFAAMDESGMPVDTRFPANNPFLLFGAVMSTLVQYVQNHDVDTIYFGCETDDSQKRSLYDRIQKKFTARYGWSLVGEEDVFIQGRLQHMWYCSK
jgi:hypothetical protein